MRKIVFLAGIIVSLNSFATMYENKNDGIVSFSNVESTGSRVVDLSKHPVNVLNAQNNTQVANQDKAIYWDKGSEGGQGAQVADNNTTLQGDFPERLTDGYFSFYGKDHHYENLMSSTDDGSYYDRNGANNDKLRENY